MTTQKVIQANLFIHELSFECLDYDALEGFEFLFCVHQACTFHFYMSRFISIYSRNARRGIIQACILQLITMISMLFFSHNH